MITVLVTGFDRKPGFLSGYTEGRIIVRFKSGQEELIGKLKRNKQRGLHILIFQNLKELILKIE